MDTIAIVLPCYNEAEMLPYTIERLLDLLNRLTEKELITAESYLLFVDDGSSDSSWEIILKAPDERVKGIKLNRRCGHQTAIFAGIRAVYRHCDFCITMDADLQDDIEVIPEMLMALEEGADIVLGVRRNRSYDSWLKKTSASAFYSILRGLGVDCVPNHGDYRLLTSYVMRDILDYGERNLYLRGIISLVGYNQFKVYYDRKPRVAGKSKYPLRKMIDFAVDGITSFSIKPVKMIFHLGILFTLAAVGIGIYSLIRYFNGETIAGWTSLMLSIWFCTGVLLIALGVIGVYIGKIYIEVKRRPRYRIADHQGLYWDAYNKD